MIRRDLTVPQDESNNKSLEANEVKKGLFVVKGTFSHTYTVSDHFVQPDRGTTHLSANECSERAERKEHGRE